MGKYEWAVGQEVMVTTIADHGRQEVIRTVEAVSRGVATVTGMRFRRDGSQITPRGERQWTRYTIAPATDGDRSRIAETHLRRDLIYRLEKARWGLMPTSALQKIVDSVEKAGGNG